MFYFLHSPLLPSLRTMWSNPVPSPPVIANEVKQSSTPDIKSGGRFTLPTTPDIKSGGPFYPSDHPEHRIWGSVLPFRPPRASNLEVRFTLPTTPGIKFGGHFHLPDSSEVKFWGHFCIIDLSDTLIWAHSLTTDLPDTLILGSFLHHRPARHPNLGVKLPAPRKLHTPLLPKPTNQSESPHLFFATQEATTGSPRGNEVEVGREMPKATGI